MYVGSKERLLDLENTWPIYRGFIYRLACLQEERCAHGSFLTEAPCKSDIDIHQGYHLRAQPARPRILMREGGP
jgi:hypothetical protein